MYAEISLLLRCNEGRRKKKKLIFALTFHLHQDRELLMRGAIVTGAASGIGAAISEALVKAGFSVILFDVTPAKQTLEKLLAIRPRSALIHQGDARKVDDIRAAIKAVNDHFAPFKALINCAGVGDVAGYPFSQVPSHTKKLL